MAPARITNSQTALIEELKKLVPEVSDNPKHMTATIAKIYKHSATVRKFFDETHLYDSSSASQFRAEMQKFEQALITSYKEVKKLEKTPVGVMNYGNTTEAVLLYGIGLIRSFRHDYFKAGYLGGDVPVLEDGVPTMGVQVKSVGGRMKVNYSTAEGVIRSQVTKYKGGLDSTAVEVGLTGLFSGDAFVAPKTLSVEQQKVAIAKRYAEILAATEYIMFRASTTDYFFVTVKLTEFSGFVQNNPHLFSLMGNTSKDSQLYSTGIIYKGMTNQDLWAIGQQGNFLAIHYPMPSYFYNTRGVNRGGRVYPFAPISGYGVGQIESYNAHVGGSGDFERIHNSFFGNYGYVRSKY